MSDEDPDKPLKRKRRWRPVLRSLHRDAGYLVVGLTVIYAVSGLAVNHISDWDPNFDHFQERHELSSELPREPHAAARAVLDELEIGERPRDVYEPTPEQLTIVFDRATLHVDRTRGVVLAEGEEPRMGLRIANWLHLNRGKRAWTYIADIYAVLLLFLAIGGMFMIKGKHGIRGRGAVLVGLGMAVPVFYVVFSGGP